MKFTISINKAQSMTTNKGLESGLAMVLSIDDKVRTTYFVTGSMTDLFDQYDREFADEDIWDRDEAEGFLYLTQILEKATTFKLFHTDKLPIEVSCGC